MVILFSTVIYVVLMIAGRNYLTVDTMIVFTGLWMLTVALGTLCGIISNIWKEIKKVVSLAAKNYLEAYLGGKKDGSSKQQNL